MRRTRLVPFAGDVDLAEMKALLRAAWTAYEPQVEALPGDLDWRLRRYPSEPEKHIVLCREGPRLLGFAWRFGGRSEADVVVLRGEAEAAAALVAWCEAVEPGAPPATIYALETNPTLGRALAERGFVPVDRTYLHFACPLASGRAPPHWPSGYRAASVADLAAGGMADVVAQRAALHRAAFGSPRVTEAAYRHLMAADGYRSDLDLVAVDQHGVLAAFVLVWHDAALNAGLFEPVGTHPAHRRRGVSRALLAEALARLHALRVSGVTVVAVGDDPITPRLYASVGFGLVGRNVAHRSG